MLEKCLFSFEFKQVVFLRIYASGPCRERPGVLRRETGDQGDQSQDSNGGIWHGSMLSDEA